MSSSVESRILTMKFETSQFQKGVTDVLSALGKLTSGITGLNILQKVNPFDKAAASAQKGVADINAASNKVDMSPMASGVEGISAKFAALATVGVTAIATITSSVVSSAGQMAKSFAIEPITQGYDEYALKLTSIQTIMAGTGQGIKPVTAALQDLNDYSDRTIYSFKDMIDNIPKFTNAGVSLATSVKAIQGVAQVAAVSGATANEAARAMYNLGQAIGQGHVKLIDWKSVELANMGTVAFKEQLMQTAEEMGTLTKAGDGMYKTLDGTEVTAKNFTTTLEKQWLTAEALTGTLEKYTDETTKLGRQAFKSATDIKTITQLMGIWKESIGSGWAQSFELIFGNLEQAKKLWGNVNNTIGLFIAASADARNKVLADWQEMGGRSAAIDAIGNVFKALMHVVKPLHAAFREAFPAMTGQRLADISKSVESFTESLIISKETMHDLRDTFSIFFDLAAIGFEIFGGLVRWVVTGIGLLLSGILPVSGGLLEVTGSFGEMTSALRKFLVDGGAIDGFFDAIISAREKVFGPLIEIIGVGLGAAIRLLAKPLGWLMDGLAYLGTFTDEVEGLVGWFERWANAGMDKAFSWVSGLSDEFSAVAGAVSGFVSAGIERVIEFFKNLEPFASDVRTIGEAFGSWVKGGVVEFIDMLRAGLEKIKPVLDSIREAMSDAFSGLGGMASGIAGGIAGSVSKAAGGIGGIDLGGMFDMGSSGDEAVSKIAQVKAAVYDQGTATEQATGIWQKFLNIISAVADWLDPILAKARDVFGNVKDEIVKAFSDGGSVAETASMLWDGFVAGIKNVGGALKGVPGMIGDMFKGIVGFLTDTVGNIGFEDLFAIVNTGFFAYFSVMMARFLGNLGGMMGAAKKVFTSGAGVFDQLTNNLQTMQNSVRAQMILTIALALGVLAVSLWVLSKIPYPRLITGILTLSVMLKMMTATLKNIGKDLNAKQAAGLIAVAAAMLLMSVAMMAMAAAVAIFGHMDPKTLMKGIGSIAAVLLTMALVSKIFTGSGAGIAMISAAIAIGILAVSLSLLAATLKLYSMLDMEMIQDGLGKLALVVGALGLVLSLFSTSALAGAFALGVLAVSLAILVPVLMAMANLDLGTMAIVVIALAGALLILGGVGYVIGVPLLILGGAVLALGLGLMAAGAGMALFGAGLATMVALGAAGAAVLTAAIISIANTLPYIFKKFGEALGVLARVVKQNAKPIGKAMQVVLEQLFNAIRKALPEFGRLMVVLIETGLRTIRKTMPDIIRTGRAVLFAILNGIKKDMDEMMDIGADIIVKFLRGIQRNDDRVAKAGANTVESLARAISREIGSRIAGLFGDAMDLGRSLVNGFAAAIRNGLGAIADAARDLAGSAWEAMRNRLDSHSPSRLLYKLGETVPQGFSGGISSGSGDPVGAAGRLADDAIGTVRRALGALSDSMSSDMDFRPSISPVLDLSDVARGASLIGDLVSGQIASVSFDEASAISAERQAAREASKGAESGNTEINFEQTIISPKVVDDVTVYRNTRNLISLAKETIK